MPIISVEIMERIDERERCQARCDVMRWIKAVKDSDN